MILILLGTQDKSFHRLLKSVDSLIKKGEIKERVIAQIGYTKYESNNMEIFDFVSKEKLEEYVDEARIIITHAGVGSILDGLKKGKVMIVAPRLKKHKEHTNDHQLQILKEFASLGYIIPMYDFSKLGKLLNKAKKFKVKKYQSTHNIIPIIENFIETNRKEVKHEKRK